MAQELRPQDPRKVGPYWLLGRLGSGGMGQVFLARSPGGRLVAVKVVRTELAEQAEFRNRFAREVAAAQKVSGLFTASVVDADVDAPMPWLATAYVPGPSLDEAITEHGPLPATSVLALAAGLAEGLGAIHAAGIVHRDLKPSNVLLAEDGPRVIDFGISRAAEAIALTGTGVVIGSPSFMSPEQARGQRVGPPSDVFSLGAVLTFAAAGQGPFGGGSSATLLYRVVFTPPDTSGLTAELRPLVERCLAKDPEQRPTTRQLLAELDTAPPAADWLPAPVTQAFPSYLPPERPDRAGPTGGRRRAARSGAELVTTPRGGEGGRPGRSRADPGRRRRSGRAPGPLSHRGHDRAPAPIRYGDIRTLIARTSDDRLLLLDRWPVSPGDHRPCHFDAGPRAHVLADLPGHVPGYLARHLPRDLAADLPGHVPGDFAADLPGHLPGDFTADLPGHLPGDFNADLPGHVSADRPGHVRGAERSSGEKMNGSPER